MNRRSIALLGVVAVAGLACLSATFYVRQAAEGRFKRQADLARAEAARIQAEVVLYSERRIDAGLTFSESLERMGLDAFTTASIVGSAQPVYNLRHVRAGNALAVGRSVIGELRAVRYQIDPDRMLWIERQPDGFRARIEAIPSETQVAGVVGQVRDSLFNAVADAGESPELALKLAEIFGWDLDFYTDPRPGDTFRVAVEKKTYSNGQTAAYGRILAAEYNNDGRVYQAVLFHDPAGHPAYYAPDGMSLQKAFLRSPLKFAAPITSHFSRNRFNPVLKFYRPHLGIDYGAPAGTPVQAIGAGRVVFAGTKGEAGNLVELRHANGYETMYMHLSRLLVHAGQRVEQGQRIGLVGMTGLATGPHLDFRILQHGAYRNFETLRWHLPPTEPVARTNWADFVAARDRWLPLLPDTRVLQANAQTRAPQGPGSGNR